MKLFERCKKCQGSGSTYKYFFIIQRCTECHGIGKKELFTKTNTYYNATIFTLK